MNTSALDLIFLGGSIMVVSLAAIFIRSFFRQGLAYHQMLDRETEQADHTWNGPVIVMPSVPELIVPQANEMIGGQQPHDTH